MGKARRRAIDVLWDDRRLMVQPGYLSGLFRCSECGGGAPKELYGQGVGEVLGVRHVRGCAVGLEWAALVAEEPPP